MSEDVPVPVLPLRDVVVLPGVTTAVAAGRPGTLAAIDAVVTDPARPRELVLLTQRDPEGPPSPANLHRVGVRARILHVQAMPGSQQVVLDAFQRVRVTQLSEQPGRPLGEGGDATPFLAATVLEVEDHAPLDEDDPAFQGLVAEVRDQAVRLARRSEVPPEALRRFLHGIEDAGVLANRVAFQLDLEVAEKQTLLETLEVEERLRRVLVALHREVQVDLERERIRSKVQAEFGDRQREHLLREQLRALKQELGEEGADAELDEMRAKLEALDLSEPVRVEVDRMLARASRGNREAPDAQVAWTWLEWVAALPWNERSPDHLDTAAARAVLDEDHDGLEPVKRRVLEYLAVHQLRRRRAEARAAQEGAADGPGGPDAAGGMAPAGGGAAEDGRAPILLFLGPPGTGKTSVVRSIARALGRRYERIALGGARDEADIRGHRRTYVGALPGRIVQGLKRAGTRNPVFCLDEVDKLGRGFQGDPGAALLEVLDPAQNDSFEDRYLDVPFDLSEVLFVCTANHLEGIPGPLLDRMEVIEFPGYTEQEKLGIARRYLLPRQRREAGLEAGQVEVSEAGLQAVISGWTREAGLRQLERELGKLCRRAALQIAGGAEGAVTFDVEDLREVLGRPRARPERRLDQAEVGVATGLYYTPAGGDAMFVEASASRGKGRLTLTGQLGDVMKESAHAALTFARDRAEALGIGGLDLSEVDLHVHVPQGAVRKDGPSAGVTMATVMASVLSGRPVRADLAMTGEITLRGRVLPIGGVQQKVLGALRAGIHEVILPVENGEDVEDLPPEVREQLTVHLVEDLGQVLDLALVGDPQLPLHLGGGATPGPPRVAN